jgi:glucan phosphoethanolaminetransferase (alkaline phosphatase superfamily)
MSSAKRRYLEWLIVLHKSLMNILKSRGYKTDPCGTSDGITKNGNNKLILFIYEEKT